MIVVKSDGEKVNAVEFKKVLFGKKAIIRFVFDEELQGKSAIGIIPADSTYIFQVGKEPEKDLQSVIRGKLKILKLRENNAIYFKNNNLLIIIDKNKLGQIIDSLQKNRINAKGFILESLVIYKLLKHNFEDDKSLLVICTGEQNSIIYLLNKSGPESVLPSRVETAKLIPKAQEILKTNQAVNKGIYYGKESFAFDKDLFEKQANIKLISAKKNVLDLLNKRGIELEDKNTLENTAAIAGACLTEKKEILAVINKKKTEYSGLKERLVIKKKKPIFRLILIALGIGLISAGLVIGGSIILEKINSPIAEPTVPALKQTPTPTQKPKVNPSNIKIKILNGSGIPGEAGKLADSLVSIGFDVLGTENADRFDYEKTEIHYKENEKQKADFIIENLKNYNTATPEASLNKDNKADIEIVIGKKFRN